MDTFESLKKTDISQLMKMSSNALCSRHNTYIAFQKLSTCSNKLMYSFFIHYCTMALLYK